MSHLDMLQDRVVNMFQFDGVQHECSCTIHWTILHVTPVGLGVKSAELWLDAEEFQEAGQCNSHRTGCPLCKSINRCFAILTDDF